MDLNRLYFDHQISLMRASVARDCASRDTHNANAKATAREVAQYQKSAGAGGAAQWEAAALTPRVPDCASQALGSIALHGSIDQ